MPDEGWPFAGILVSLFVRKPQLLAREMILPEKPTSSFWQRIAILLILVFAVARICSCHWIYSPVIDEAPTIAAGIEFLDRGTYRLETLHPPFARIISAIGPFAVGLRYKGGHNIWGEGAALLNSLENRKQVFALARLGNLLPFFTACFAVASWAKSCGGSIACVASLFFFTTLPVILGNASIATLDLSCASFTLAALVALSGHLERPSLSSSVLVGVLAALALLSKFSSIVFLAFCGTHMLLARLFLFPRPERESRHSRLLSFVVLLAASAYTIWAGYGFSFHTLSPIDDRSASLIRWMLDKVGIGREAVLSFIASVPVPAPEFFDGLLQLPAREKQGHLNCLFGDVRTHGWSYFYPVRLLVKTPLPFILLSLYGGVSIVRDAFAHDGDWRRKLTPLLCSAAVLEVGMLSHINNGLRQLLLIYPLLSIASGIGCCRLLKEFPRFRLGVALVIGLGAWQAAIIVTSFPDYLSYFNEFAIPHPERFSADSDIDWGQDVDRMATKLRQLNADSVSINVRTGVMELDNYDLPSWRPLAPGKIADGWIALSVTYLELGASEPPFNQYAWLKSYEPIERVGNSIVIYKISTTRRDR